MQLPVRDEHRGRNHRICQKHREYGWQQAKSTPAVEGAERNAPVLLVLLEQEGCDQESTENKEEIDTERTLFGDPERMQADDRCDRQSPDSV